MTRVYDTSLKCSSCHEHGPFGWLYQCSQDREEMIEEKLVRGRRQSNTTACQEANVAAVIHGLSGLLLL